MEKDYYAEIFNEIRKLIKTDPNEAAKKLEIELNMPYIPKKYEIKFGILLDELKNEIKLRTNINNELSKSQVIEILLENNKVKLPMAIAKLQDLNLKSCINDLHKVIANKNVNNMIKTIIYEYCVEQGVDHNFEWNGKFINPKIVDSVIKLKIYQDSYLQIENTILQNPSLKHVSKSLLEMYALNTFPSFIDETSGLGLVIIGIAQESLGLPNTMTNDFKRIIKIKQYL